MHLLYAHRYKYQAGRRYARYTAAQRVQFYCMEDLYYIIIVLLRMRYSLTDCILCTSGAHTECAMHDAMCQMRPRSALFVLFRIFILFFCTDFRLHDEFYSWITRKPYSNPPLCENSTITVQADDIDIPNLHTSPKYILL